MILLNFSDALQNESLRLALVVLAFGAIFGIAELWHKVLNPPVEWTRKFVHVGCGIIIALFHQIFTSNWPVIALALGTIIFIVASRSFNWFRSIYNVQRDSKGDYYYLIAALFLYTISHDHPVYYLISMLTLTISDALAAILGSTYQRVTYTVEHHYKSIEGSATFFLFTFLIVHIPLLLLTDIDPLRSILTAVQISLIVTCLEAICLNGIDNLFVPVGTYYLLFKFQNLSSATIIEVLGWQCVILAITNIIAWKFHILTISGAITFQLFLFGTFTLGDPTWMIAPLVAVAILLIALVSLNQKSGNFDIKIWQVVAVFYLTLVPGILVVAHNIFVNYVDTPSALTAKNSFYPLFAGAVTAQLAITLFRLFFLYARKQKWAMITLTGRISASREGSDAVIFDEGIAPAISEEKSAADESVAGGRKLTEKVIMAQKWQWQCNLFLVACSILAIVPLALWVQTGTINITDAAIASAVAAIGAFVYGLIYKRQIAGLNAWKFPFDFPLHFPWELRLQMFSNAIGTLIVLPFYLYMELK